jgi:hypothetical protein
VPYVAGLEQIENLEARQRGLEADGLEIVGYGHDSARQMESSSGFECGEDLRVS